MPQLVRSADRWPLMLLILYNPSLGRAVQRGAAAELARSHKWFGISDPNHAAVDDRSAREPIRSAFVGVELYPTAPRWRCFASKPLVSRSNAKISLPNPLLSKAFPHLARHFDRARCARS